MSKIFVDQVDPKTATTLTLGTSGDTVSIPSGVTLANAGTMTGVPAPTSGIAASAIDSGTIATARLGSGTASSSTFLRGDQTYAAAGGGSWTYLSGTALSDTTHLAVALNNSYKINVITIDNLTPMTDDAAFRIAAATDGSTFTVGARASLSGHRIDTSNNLSTFTGAPNANGAIAIAGNVGYNVSSGNTLAMVMYLYDFGSTTTAHVADATFTFIDSSERTSHQSSAIQFGTSNAVTHVQFDMSTGNLRAGNIRLYGIENS